MKKFIFVFLLFTKVVLGQNLNNKIVYLDSSHIETSSENYRYYRIVEDYYLDKEKYSFTQYYNSNKIECKGFSKNKDTFIKTGEIISFYESGNTKSKINYKEGHKSGKCEIWYENGTKKLEGEYVYTENKKDSDKETINESILKIDNYWDTENNQKIVSGNGSFTDEDVEEIKNSSTTTSSGKVLNGYKDGIWVGSDSKNKFTFEETYVEGKLISGISKDENGATYNYTILNVRPEPKGGISTFYDCIMRNLNQPESSTVNGKIIAAFIIDNQGKITETRIIKSLQPDIDAETIRVINLCNDFKPGLSRGIKIDCEYVIPITLISN